ncbi:MAG: EI24 domain-containing protein, partial [Alphaproteobacteria bacterium]|nr:EI24 domain-containing protein [Alphaproteobacteria bacterium]
MLARAIGLTLNQINEPAFWKTLLKSLLLSVPLFVLIIWLGLEGIAAIPETGWLWGAVDWLVDKLGGVGVFFAALVLFPAIATMIMGAFLDDIAEAVEKRHYPADPAGTPMSIPAGIWSGLKLAIWTILLNLIALPFYLLGLFFPPLSLGLYYVINGWLLNKEYFEIAATRHVDKPTHKRLRQQYGGTLFLGGCVVAFLFTIPLLNLVAPHLGAA